MCRALEHARYLRKYHGTGSNWVITEMAGLLSVASAWPELREADEWRERAVRLLEEELCAQTYPDGIQKELSSNYQLAVLWHMDFVVETMHGAGIPISQPLANILEALWNCLAYSLAPDGFTPQNGDSDHAESSESQIISPLEAARPILDAAKVYRREDWVYLATQGTRGTRPDGQPSVLWDGQTIDA